MSAVREAMGLSRSHLDLLVRSKYPVPEEDPEVVLEYIELDDPDENELTDEL